MDTGSYEEEDGSLLIDASGRVRADDGSLFKEVCGGTNRGSLAREVDGNADADPSSQGGKSPFVAREGEEDGSTIS